MCINVPHEDPVSPQLSLCSYYLKRGYPEDILKNSVEKIQNLSRNKLLYPEKIIKTTAPRQYMVMTYSPCNPKTIQVIRKHWHMLQYSSSPSQFLLPPMVSYRKGPTMQDSIVSAKVKQPTMDPRPPSGPLPKCINISCLTCKYLMKKTKIQKYGH